MCYKSCHTILFTKNMAIVTNILNNILIDNKVGENEDNKIRLFLSSLFFEWKQIATEWN